MWFLIQWIHICLLVQFNSDAVKVVHPPTFIKMPPSIAYINPEEPLLIPCYAKANPEPRYYWTLNGKHAYWIKPYNTTVSQELSHSTDITLMSKQGNTEYQLHSNDSHTLYTIDESGLWYFGVQKISNYLKAGLYQCIAINPFGKALSIPLKLEVARIGTFHDLNPKFIYIKPNETKILNCSTTKSIPTAKVQWMIKDDEDSLINFVHEDRNHIIDDDGNLHLLNMNPIPYRNLTYTCVIHNLILHTMKTGPDIKLLFHSNALATTTTTPPPTSIQTINELPKKIQVLYHSPSNQIVLLNQSLSLKCIMYGYPLPKIHWEFMTDSMDTDGNDHQYKDVKSLPEKYGIKLKNHGMELYIPTVQMIHHGSYRCSGINLDYMIPTDDPYVIFNVTVESKPHFAEYPKNTILPENSSIVLRCSINEEITKPSATLNWLVNGEPVERYLNGLRKVIRNNVLYLYNLTIKDSAVFQCILHNLHGINIINAYIHVWNQPPAFINVIHGIQYIIEGQQILLPCETFGAPQAEVNWFFNEKQLNTFKNLMKDDYIIEKNGNLHIISAKLSHNGTYLCKASNIFGISQSTGILFIRKQTRIISGPLIERNVNTTTNNTTTNTTTTTTHSNKRINMKYLIEGSNIQLACKVETDPLHEDQLTIVWRKDNLTLQDAFEHSDRLNITSSNNESLLIVNLISSDTGIYTCIASTKLDSVNSSIHLIVQGRPKPPKSLKLLCNYHNPLYPYIMLTWEYDETIYSPIHKVLITYITGFYRPIEGYSSLKHNNKDNFKFIDYRYFNQSINNHKNDLYWFNQTTFNIAQSMIKQSIINNQWNTIDLIPEINIMNYLKHKNQLINNHTIHNTTNYRNTTTNNSNIINLLNIPFYHYKRAFLSIHSDVIYHFRIELLNHIGKSLPSDIIPKLNSKQNELCIFPPKPLMINSDYLIVYGNKPNNLIIQWKPIDPIEHNGPGLIYRLTINCLDCINGPTKNVLNYTIVNNWSKDRIELTNLITPRLTPKTDDQNQIDIWNIETFRTYQVTLQAENDLGSSGTKPLVFTGRSGEDIPQLIPIELRILHINSKNITFSWKMINDSDFSIKMNGIFQGFRIEWCNADLSNDSCEFYKKSQDYILEQPPSWSFPNLRQMSSQIFLDNQPNDVIDIKSTSVTMSSTTIDHSNIQYENDCYIVHLNELPGKTKLKIWVRILNIQYAGPESDVLIVETKEGVPEKVSELTITFIGVNHIEVSWIKPMIINGNLISYDLEIYLNNFMNTTEIFSLHNSQLITSITIEDPEQCATRISGLKMNTHYLLCIWAKTSVGRGEPNFVNFRTATLSHDYGYIPFTISSIQDHVNSINLTLKTSFSSLNNDLSKSDMVNDSTDPSTTFSASTSSSPTLFTTEQSTNISNINNIEQIEKLNHQFMFYVQFRQLGTEIWEETQRELHNSWIVLNNLNKDSQYEIRIVYIPNNGQSIVSHTRIIHIPINNQYTIINNQWKLLFKNNQYFIIIMILCCLFLLISLISCSCLLIYYWSKHKQSIRLKKISDSLHNRYNNNNNNHNNIDYLHSFHCQQLKPYNNIQYELPIEQQQQQSPQQQLPPPLSQQQQSMEPYLNWKINNQFSSNYIDNITDHSMMMLMTPTSTTTTMMNNRNDDSIYQFNTSCICQYNHNNTITTTNNTTDLLNQSLITTCNSPFINNNCITFLKLPQSQTNSFTEDNFFNSLINIDTTYNTTYTTTITNTTTTTNTTNNSNNNTESNQHTYISSLLSRV
ncbi:unnamed protein product [Schistosoma rodhaini]|uniref:Receptor protein-tyrosine kinase n=1 Tax=Schistosoma rodhaini TaxID=6188 RepID=A0AA85GF15_9TREM|nr:unnamed protein product [Schistosoma rodhaini]